MDKRLLGLMVAALFVVGCSTTANQTNGDGVAIDEASPSDGSTSSRGGRTSTRPGATATDGATDAASEGATVGSAGSGSSTGTGGSSGETPGGTAPGATPDPDPGAPPPPPEPTGPQRVTGSGPGYTDTEIRVGIQLVVDTQAGFAAVGANAAAPDETGIAERMVEWINANGGIAGRTLVPVFHQTEALTGTWASQANATCASFTQDNEVVAAVTSATGGSDALWACTSERGLPLVERNIWPWDDQYFTSRPDMLYVPGKMSATRWVEHYVRGLKDLGFFDDATVGILHFDGQPFERIMDDLVLPELAAIGIDDPEIATITSPPSISAFGNMAGEINNALVRFRSRDVSHIMMIENAGILPFFALPSADQQRYYPQWGFTSLDIPATLNTIPAPDQLANGQGVSWVPPTDVPLVELEDDPDRAAREAPCREAYDGSNAGHHNGSMCDALLFLKAAFDRAGSLDAPGLAAAVRGLGMDYQSPMGVRTRFPGDQFYDGADAYRLFDWKDVCATVDGEDVGCYQYVSGPKDARR